MPKVYMMRLLCGATLAIAVTASGPAALAVPFTFTAGDLVVSVEGNGSNSAGAGTSATGNTGANADTYLDNQAAPLTLEEFSTTGTKQNPIASLELPTVTQGGNSAISGEYGSSSEGSLQLTGNKQYLTIAGYGVNAGAYNNVSDVNGTGTALAQSCSLSAAGACGSTPLVPRVIARIGADGSVNSSTVLYNVANENNPRSVYSTDGNSFYISGQGTGNPGDTTGGVFYVAGLGPNQTAIPITGQDSSSGTVSQDTREVQVYNHTLYVSVDSKKGSGNNRDFIGTLGSPPATSLYSKNGASPYSTGPTMLNGYGNNGGTGKITITALTANGVNKIGSTYNLSPEDYYFANATTLYVADSGDPKNDSAANSKGVDLGDGGLQKWSLVGSTWTLDYTLSAGLDLVANTDSDGTSGLYGLTGEDVDIGGIEYVELFATNFTLNDLDQTYLYGITDALLNTTDPGADGSFAELAMAPADTTFKGVAFAPVPEPSSLWLMASGLAAMLGLFLAGHRKNASAV